MIDPLATSRAYAALAEVVDPELGLDIVEMGLVYDVRVAGGRVEVDMTLTTPGCPVSELLPAEATEALQRALPELEVVVQLVWDPPWTPDHLSDGARSTLGYASR
jgi:metal-sulfur cluster biosynthetic enzyme